MIPGITASRRRTIPSPGGTDPHWANVTLLMHFDGDIVDVKGGVFNTVGTVGFAAGRFNQAMELVTGDSGAVEPVAGASMDLPADFTIEGWLKPAAGSSGAFINRFELGSYGAGWQIYLESTGKLSFYQYVTGGYYPISNAGPDIRDGNWHHVAVARQGSALRMYVDGLLVGTATNSTQFTSTVAKLSVGFQAQGGGRYPLRGGIDEVRITNGVARYTANFTRPVTAFPNS